MKMFWASAGHMQKTIGGQIQLIVADVSRGDVRIILAEPGDSEATLKTAANRILRDRWKERKARHAERMEVEEFV